MVFHFLYVSLWNKHFHIITINDAQYVNWGTQSETEGSMLVIVRLLFNLFPKCQDKFESFLVIKRWLLGVFMNVNEKHKSMNL